MKNKKRRKKFRMWTADEVKKVLPLVKSIMLTIRERMIQANSAMLNIKRLNVGRPSRHDMIELENLRRLEREADLDIEDALDELEELGVYCYDAAQCISAFAFTTDWGIAQRGAWFLYSPFGEELYWRFDGESSSVRHDLRELKV